MLNFADISYVEQKGQAWFLLGMSYLIDFFFFIFLVGFIYLIITIFFFNKKMLLRPT